MIIGVLSDIHGNLEAFSAVVNDLEQRNVDEVIILGDLIGYGPDPEEVVQLCISQSYSSVLGNHEAALFNKKMRSWLNFQARENSVHTEKLMSSRAIDFCRNLETTLTRDNALFVHGFPPRSILQYVTTKTEKMLKNYFSSTSQEFAFVGHTHDLLWVSSDGENVICEKPAENILALEQGKKYILNAGSVGQPRDGDNSAKYLLWNVRERTIEVVYVPYDFRETARKILQRGFPEAYGLRLG